MFVAGAGHQRGSAWRRVEAHTHHPLRETVVLRFTRVWEFNAFFFVKQRGTVDHGS